MKLPGIGALQAAAEVVAKSMPPTPQYSWPLLNARVGTELWVKHENHTPVGSFKIRGGLVYMEKLLQDNPAIQGIAAATRGNFGQAIAFAARKHGLAATIVVPFGNSREKNRAMLGLGAELIENGEDFQAASEHCELLARERGLHQVPSFHEWLVHGTGVFALEMLTHSPALDTVYVPVGLGSSICGMMAARDALGLKTKIVGIVSEGAPAYALSFAQHKSVSHAVTTHLADGMACRTPNAEALDLILNGVDRVMTVSEEEVGMAVAAYFTDTHNIAEGAGAAGLAGLLQERSQMRGKCVGVVLTGGNVDAEIFAKVLQKYAGHD